jgi:hypothetical protein
MENTKFTLCVLCTQLGKTFTAIQQIQTELQNDTNRSIHIITTMNSLLNNEQFSSRLNHIEHTYGKNSVCIFASKYTGKYKHVKNREELQGICLNASTCPRVIVMCSNPVRFEDGIEFIRVLQQNQTVIRRVFCYYDELHDYISDLLRRQIEEIHSFSIVQRITALTATPDKIWKKEGFWSTLRIIHLNDYNDHNYIGFDDMQFICVEPETEQPYVRPKLFDYDEMDKQTIDYIRHILQLYPTILGNNTFSFIPAHKRRLSHNSVRELLFSINPECVVILMNATEKSIQFMDTIGMKTIPLISQYKTVDTRLEIEEACDTIARIIQEYNLMNRPKAITGLLSVGMGQTLTHPILGSFTSAIFSHLDLTNDEIYQLFGRITGRMKDWKSYCITHVYCPSTIANRCEIMEECAKRMVIEHNGTSVTQDEYRAPMYAEPEKSKTVIDNLRMKKQKKINIETSKFERGYQIFDTKEENDIYAMEIGATRKSNKYKTDENGFKICSQSIVKVHLTEDIITHFKKCTVGSNMDKKLEDVKLGEYTYRRYVCYDSLTDITSEKYVTCWFKRISN